MGLDVELHLPPDIQVGGGVSERVGELASGNGLTRVLVVTDPVMVDSGVAGRVAESLEAAGIATATFSDITGEPTTDFVDAGVDALRAHEADGIVAVGGGSPLDTAKAVSVMATNGGALPDYLGYHKIPDPGVPLIAVPDDRRHGLGGHPRHRHHRHVARREDDDPLQPPDAAGGARGLQADAHLPARADRERRASTRSRTRSSPTSPRRRTR